MEYNGKLLGTAAWKVVSPLLQLRRRTNPIKLFQLVKETQNSTLSIVLFILADPNIGSALQSYSRRPTSSRLSNRSEQVKFNQF